MGVDLAAVRQVLPGLPSEMGIAGSTWPMKLAGLRRFVGIELGRDRVPGGTGLRSILTQDRIHHAHH